MKNQGTAFIDLGGGSTTITVFEEGLLTHTGVIPVGGDHITKDISIVLKHQQNRQNKLNINLDMPFMMTHQMMNSSRYQL